MASPGPLFASRPVFVDFTVDDCSCCSLLTPAKPIVDTFVCDDLVFDLSDTLTLQEIALDDAAVNALLGLAPPSPVTVGTPPSFTCDELDFNFDDKRTLYELAQDDDAVDALLGLAPSALLSPPTPPTAGASAAKPSLFTPSVALMIVAVETTPKPAPKVSKSLPVAAPFTPVAARTRSKRRAQTEADEPVAKRTRSQRIANKK
jgi:hypothetical protein